MPGHLVFSGSQAWEVVRRLPGRKDAVAARLRRKAAFLRAGDVDAVVATGAAVGAILENARRSNPDLIVMGSPHRSWFDRVLFGSTLRRVLRRATVPVLGGARRRWRSAMAEREATSPPARRPGMDPFCRWTCRCVTRPPMQLPSQVG